MPIYKILLLKLSLLLCLVLHRSSCYGEPPQLKSADECADWFLASWSTLNGKYACAGEAKMHNSSNELLVMEWFEVRFVEPKERKIYHYIESRNVFEHVNHIDPWEKWLRRDEDYFWSMGEYSEKLSPVTKGDMSAKRIGDSERNDETSERSPHAKAFILKLSAKTSVILRARTSHMNGPAKSNAALPEM